MSRKRAAGTGFVAFAICLFGVLYNRSSGVPIRNPSTDPQKALEANLAVPAKLAGSLRRACGDCHSNETRWPWYSKIPPFSQLLAHDVQKGRRAMNFSEWSGKPPLVGAGVLMAACSGVQSGRMPPTGYLALHPESRLSPEESAALCEWSREESQRAMAQNRINKERKN